MVKPTVFATVTTVTAQTLANWESHGEVTDPQILAGPALDPALVGNQGTWIAGPNKRFEGMSLGEAKSIVAGTLQNTDPSTFLPYKAPARWIEDLPTDFDWREQDIAAKCPSLKEIRDQAACGSCWAHGTTEAMTDRICIASQGADTTHLSAEDVTSCCGALHGDMGCNGGVPATVYQYWKTTGVVDGGNYGDKSGCYSYQLPQCAHHSNSSKYTPCEGSQRTPKCEKKCIDNGADWKTSKNYGADGGYSVCPQGDGTKCVDHMMQDIYQNGPISAQFFVHQSFESYQSGVYHSGNPVTDPMLGGHAIKILGWGVEEGEDYWLVANSWNEDWAGLGGFFKLRKGKNEGQVENPIINGGPVAGMPKVKGTVSEADQTHYGKPPCLDDEIEGQLSTGGSLCAAPCDDAGTCPTDVDSSCTNPKPQCILQDQSSGKKYCGLTCGLTGGNCPTGAKCSSSLAGVCVYPDGTPVGAQSALTIMSEALVVADQTHYGKPPCLDDEIEGQLSTGGSLCAAPCDDAGTCPTDVDASCTNPKPQCILQDQSSGKQYCGLTCGLTGGNCPTGAKCSSSLAGVCVYPDGTIARGSQFSMIAEVVV